MLVYLCILLVFFSFSSFSTYIYFTFNSKLHNILQIKLHEIYSGSVYYISACITTSYSGYFYNEISEIEWYFLLSVIIFSLLLNIVRETPQHTTHRLLHSSSIMTMWCGYKTGCCDESNHSSEIIKNNW